MCFLGEEEIVTEYIYFIIYFYVLLNLLCLTEIKCIYGAHLSSFVL